MGAVTTRSVALAMLLLLVGLVAQELGSGSERCQRP